MKKYMFLCTCLCTTLLLQICIAQTNNTIDAAQPQVRQLAYDTVVQLTQLDSNMRVPRRYGQGSGTVISPNGYILTNYHVISDDDGNVQPFTRVSFTEDKYGAPIPRYIAEYYDGSEALDIAILQITHDRNGDRVSPSNMRSMTIGHIDDIFRDDELDVWGYPYTGGDTINATQGVISGFTGEDQESNGQAWIKSDASIARGNSGGAAINEEGILIAIPTQIFGSELSETQGWLRPANMADQFLRDVPRVNYTYTLPKLIPSEVGDRLSDFSLRDRSMIIDSVEESQARFHEVTISQAASYDFFTETYENNDMEIAIFNEDFELLDEDDDGGYKYEALISSLYLESGTYYLGVAEVNNELAKYTIGMKRRSAFSDSFDINSTLNDELGKAYLFNTKNYNNITIKLASNDFDTYLEVLDSNGEIIAKNDDSGINTNSELENLSLTANRLYYIRIMNYSETNTIGSFNLSVAINNNITGPAAGVADPATGPAGPAAGPTGPAGPAAGPRGPTGPAGPVGFGLNTINEPTSALYDLQVFSKENLPDYRNAIKHSDLYLRKVEDVHYFNNHWYILSKVDYTSDGQILYNNFRNSQSHNTIFDNTNNSSTTNFMIYEIVSDYPQWAALAYDYKDIEKSKQKYRYFTTREQLIDWFKSELENGYVPESVSVMNKSSSPLWGGIVSESEEAEDQWFFETNSTIMVEGTVFNEQMIVATLLTSTMLNSLNGHKARDLAFNGTDFLYIWKEGIEIDPNKVFNVYTYNSAVEAQQALRNNSDIWFVDSAIDGYGRIHIIAYEDK